MLFLMMLGNSIWYTENDHTDSVHVLGVNPTKVTIYQTYASFITALLALPFALQLIILLKEAEVQNSSDDSKSDEKHEGV